MLENCGTLMNAKLAFCEHQGERERERGGGEAEGERKREIAI